MRTRVLSFAESGLSIIGLLFFLFHSAAGATVWRVPQDFPVIQAAIDAAAPGDEIVLADGGFSGPGNIDLNLRGKSLTIRSEHGPDFTTVDALRQGRHFIFTHGESRATVIRDLNFLSGFTDGEALHGGSMLIGNASPLIQNCRFQANSVAGLESNGGAIAITGGSPLIENCEFLNNSNTGQLGFGGAISVTESAQAEVIGCRFIRNSGDTAGAIGVEAASLQLADCVFRQNRAESG